MPKRAVIIVLDSAGIGEMPDSEEYGDKGANTLVNTARRVGGLHLPHLEAMGLGNLAPIEGVRPVERAEGAYGIMQEMSRGKDTTTGHWEMMGIITEKPFPTYPHGFPDEIIQEFEKRIGRKVLGNIAASGTEIIKMLGEEHIKTGYPIVYTSADSVFQIAAHEEVIPLEELYNMCKIARSLLTGEHNVGRVIARPFRGEPGNFYRTANRHDYALEPGRNILDCILEKGQEVVGIGKIKDIFAGRGVTRSYPTGSNQEGVNRLVEVLSQDFPGLIFVNLVDFDQLYGHRNDASGYARALQEFDARLPEIRENMQDDDMLIITADHGCDPTTPGTDHTREQVPLLVYGRKLKKGVNLGRRKTFADVGQTAAEHLEVPVDKNLAGESFYVLVRC
ncbi:phosphopentomutase [Thermosyntropha lipolytica DSM 11003]|uniref:Phosphopentomutase n=1 Tax=Thermosyntropha lipolytica DSM 11003 TaxID=1123382 RepID=A0A1M5RXG4_9FIRM|nr:phosphopentomutase [Thermosyntropha lipolytica]SHH30871.1 phosphopentomutase [Thermosyntropha lipolytica DSM 11003]